MYKQLLSLKKEAISSSSRIALFRSKIERLESTLGVNGRFEEAMIETDYSIGPYKGSAYQT